MENFKEEEKQMKSLTLSLEKQIQSEKTLKIQVCFGETTYVLLNFNQGFVTIHVTPLFS